MTTRTYKVEGMTCASCVRRVEKALAEVPGVCSASVNLAMEEATVVFEDDIEQALFKALKDRGYRLISGESLELAIEQEASQRLALLRVIAAWIFTLPLMLPMLPGVNFHLPWLIQAGLSFLVVVATGRSFFENAIKQLLLRELTMDTLVALGAGVSWTFALSEALRGAPHPPFETAAALVAFLLIGKYLENKAKHRATNALEALLELAPPLALRIQADDSEELVMTQFLKKGDRIRIKPGDAIPVDGVVIHGQADVVEALLTGEPLPIPKTKGDAVIAGAVVHGGSLDVSVQKKGRETWLAHLGQQVVEAQSSRAPIQDVADKVSGIFIPVILLIALLTLAGWWIASGSFSGAWRPAVTVLVIACPCALGLATPVAMAASLSTAARNGLLVRNAKAMEALARVTDLVFDKTGTLTEGHPKVIEIQTFDISEKDLLTCAAALERNSEHPISKGILEFARDVEKRAVVNFRAHPGGGVEGIILGEHLRLGNPEWLGFPQAHTKGGTTVVGLANDAQLLGLIFLADRLRPEAKEVTSKLRQDGLSLHLLSGDRQDATQILGHMLEIDDAKGGCSPTQKQARIQELQKAGSVVAFVGDGVNDGPALAQADAGISLKTLEAAKAAAPLNLLRDGLEPLLKAHQLARKTHRIIRQNLAWAFGYNLILVPLAAFGALDTFGGPMLAAAAMGMSSLTVVLNALRLRRS